jgi:hypothetical protein
MSHTRGNGPGGDGRKHACRSEQVGFVALYINFDTNKATIRPEEGKANNRCVEIVKK